MSGLRAYVCSVIDSHLGHGTSPSFSPPLTRFYDTDCL